MVRTVCLAISSCVPGRNDSRRWRCPQFISVRQPRAMLLSIFVYQGKNASAIEFADAKDSLESQHKCWRHLHCPHLPGAPLLRNYVCRSSKRFEPLSYRADLTLDPVKDSFTASLLIRLQVSESTNTIWLNAHHLSIASVTLTSGGNKLTGKATPAGEDFVGIAFDTPVPTGPSELRIQYTGEVRKGDTGGSLPSRRQGQRLSADAIRIDRRSGCVSLF